MLQHKEPTPEEWRKLVDETLSAYAARYGRKWKDKLATDWATGRSLHEPEGATLQSIRNTYGPSWLMKYKLPS
jgi:hypothetical protein